jgi:hypothetical protein
MLLSTLGDDVQEEIVYYRNDPSPRGIQTSQSTAIGVRDTRQGTISYHIGKSMPESMRDIEVNSDAVTYRDAIKRHRLHGEHIGESAS